MGGAGSAVVEQLHEDGRVVEVMQFGLPDNFLEQGTQQEQLEMAGLTAQQILAAIKQNLP